MFTWSFIKKNPSLLPLIGFVALGVTGATFYTIRVAARDPEIRINRRNEEPWNEYKAKQYKFYSPVLEESQHRSKIPEY